VVATVLVLFSFDAPASHLLKISDLLPSSKSVNPIVVDMTKFLRSFFAPELTSSSSKIVFV